MERHTRHDRRHWEALWSDTVWESWRDGRWRRLDDHPAAPQVVISAWNPAGQRLPEAVNAARDAVLYAELSALALDPHRARGRDPSGAWHEDGWLIAHEPARSVALLRRYGQIAGWLIAPEGADYLWAEESAAR